MLMRISAKAAKITASTVSTIGGAMKGDELSPIKYVAKGRVFPGDLVQINDDGTVSCIKIPKNETVDSYSKKIYLGKDFHIWMGDGRIWSDANATYELKERT